MARLAPLGREPRGAGERGGVPREADIGAVPRAECEVRGASPSLDSTRIVDRILGL